MNEPSSGTGRGAGARVTAALLVALLSPRCCPEEDAPRPAPVSSTATAGRPRTVIMRELAARARFSSVHVNAEGIWLGTDLLPGPVVGFDCRVRGGGPCPAYPTATTGLELTVRGAGAGDDGALPELNAQLQRLRTFTIDDATHIAVQPVALRVEPYIPYGVAQRVLASLYASGYNYFRLEGAGGSAREGRGLELATLPRERGRLPDISVCLGVDDLELIFAEPGRESIHLRSYGGPPGAGAYDYAGLYRELVALRGESAAAPPLGVTADSNVPWEAVARAIGTASVRLEEDAYWGPIAFEQAKVRLDAHGKPERLYDAFELLAPPSYEE